MSAPRVRLEPMFELSPRVLSDLRDSVDRRRHERFSLQRPAVVFYVAPDGTIAQVWNKVKVKGHAEEVLAAAQAL